MIYGLYLSAQGAQVQTLRQDVLANNLANASTPSFKRDLLQVQWHPQYDEAQGKDGTPKNLSQLTGGVSAGDVVTDFRTGPQMPTGNSLDIAITGKGFLRVAEGADEYLTRDGRLAVDPDGTLVTREHGLTVMGKTGGAVTGLDPGLPVDFAADGTISQAGLPRGLLGIVQPESSRNLQKVGRNLYTNTGNLQPLDNNVRILGGYLEQSGVNSVTEMVDLIETSRAYEANVNMIKYQDESLGRLLASAGRK